MMKLKLVLVLLALAVIAKAQVAHPRIWLDNPNLARLQSLKAANDARWLAFRATADGYVAKTAPAYGYIASAAYTNGGVFSGTGTCTVAFSPNSAGNGSGGTGFIAVSSGSPSSTITITGGGAQYFNSSYYALAPTLATLLPGTATCSGTATVSASVNNTRDAASFSSTTILYAYEGDGWYSALQALALAYKVTGNPAYSNQAIILMDAIAASGSGPLKVDSYYPSRNLPSGMALAFDWVYDELNPTQIANYVALMEAWWTTMKSGWGTISNGCDNYFSGHILGFGLAAIALEGDDAAAPAILTDGTHGILTLTNSKLVPDFRSGCFAGGTAPESYSYGGATFMRYFQFFWAMQTAGKASSIVDGATPAPILDYEKTAATSLMYNMRPDLWAITDEGEWTGNYTRLYYPSYGYQLALLTAGTKEGNYLNWLFANNTVSSAPGGIGSAYVLTASPLTNFLYAQQSPIVTSPAALPLSYVSAGDLHTFVRSDWTTSAVHTTFMGGVLGSSRWTGYHEMLTAGAVSIQRGSDYLLINAGQWRGADGYSGSPTSFNRDSVWLNTFSLTDTTGSGAYCYIGSYYGIGCNNQNTYAGEIPAIVATKGTADYTFAEADLTLAYGQASHRPLSVYHRSLLSVGGIDFVFDRAVVVNYATAGRKLMWHWPANATYSLAGTTETIMKGDSALYLTTLLPTAPKINVVQDATTWSGGVPLGTMRMEVSDPHEASAPSANFLTVLAPIAAIAPSPTSTLITVPGFYGALYDDGAAPRIALFAADGTVQTSATYSAQYDSLLAGRHVLMGLTPGTYAVRKDGMLLSDGNLVGTDGSLSFLSRGGGTFSVTAGPAGLLRVALLGRGWVGGRAVLR